MNYKVIYKVIMDNMESKQQAEVEAIKSIRDKISNDHLGQFLNLVEISDEDIKEYADNIPPYPYGASSEKLQRLKE
jgi:hypothetical protein